MEQMIRRIQTSFNAWLLKIVFRFRWMWIILFFMLGILSAIVILIWPGMKLPESVEFQLFRESHPFEQYDLVYKNEFWFERILRVSKFLKIQLSTISFYLLYNIIIFLD